MQPQDYFSEFYLEHILTAWKDRSKPNPAERYLLNRYLENPNNRILEAGTGGGLLSFYMEDLGFLEIDAFDIIPEMIQAARDRGEERGSKVRFEVADASNLKLYTAEQYDNLIYLGQIFCMISNEHLKTAFEEAYRVAKNNGLLICSFMDWEARWYNPIISIVINIYRFLKGQTISKYYIPQLKLHGKFNYRYFFYKECTCYWPKSDYIIKLLQETGFYIEALYKEEQITSKKGTAFYLICRKRPIGS